MPEIEQPYRLTAQDRIVAADAATERILRRLVMLSFDLQAARSGRPIEDVASQFSDLCQRDIERSKWPGDDEARTQARKMYASAFVDRIVCGFSIRPKSVAQQ
jgi:hypothetical protein